MTLDEIRDDLARRAGWLGKGGRWYHPVYHRLGSGQKRHPLPLTRDAAADAMPEGWDWERKDGLWCGGKRGGARQTMWHMVSVPDTGDEIDDRYRLAHAAVVAMEKEPGND